MEINPSDFGSLYDWIGSALMFCVWAIPILLGLGIFVGFIVAVIRYGPIEGAIAVARSIAMAFGNDFPHFSFRRTFAIAYVAIKEALRRKVLVVFAIFALVFLFAGLFLDVESQHPARLYLSFVLTTTTFLVLFLALFLSVFSIPSDIVHRTIYTVVTKPVRASEIVLGRILGFTAVGSMILVVMALVSYVFVVRGMRHEHGIDGPLEAVKRVNGKTEWVGKTTLDQHHRHKFRVGADGKGVTEHTHQHWHNVEKTGENQVVFSKPQGELVARVPKFGQLAFLDRQGNPSQKGVNVGYVWEYRSYIEGGTKQAAIWQFDDVNEANFPDGYVTLALNLSVFRTYKAQIKVPVRGVLYIQHPDPTKNLIAEPISFLSQEFQEQLIRIPRKLHRYRVTGEASEELDLFKDLVQDGKLMIKLQCDDNQQFFGVSTADVYIRMPDAPFWMNFLKGFVVIWLQMIAVIGIAVMYSTLLKSPVALVATSVSFLLGYFQDFVRQMAESELYGGGPIEAFVRIVTQDNIVTPLELSWDWVETVIKWSDKILSQVLYLFASLLPTFKHISRMTEFVAYNYDIPSATLGRFAISTLAYTLVFSLLGYFFLKSRELAG